MDPAELTGTNNNNMDQAANTMDEVCLDAAIPQETPQETVPSSKESNDVDIRCGKSDFDYSLTLVVLQFV